MSESTDPARPLLAVHQAAGARMTEVAPGALAPRNYGDPVAEYEAARGGAVVVDRADRALVRVHGRDPVRMIQGLVTNDLAGTPEGGAVFATMLTPKGRTIAEMRVVRRPGGELLMETAAAALPAVLEHLKKFVPPLFARAEEVTGDVAVIGVYGPEAGRAAAAVVDGDWPGGDVPEETVVHGRFGGAGVLALRTEYTGPDGGWDLIVPAEALRALWEALAGAGARPAGHATLEVLRIEAGTPRWGAELDPDRIPLEAGLRERAISQTKGCYTGQEVIIRILHRGHVNWHLRGLLLGDAPAPAPGAELVRAEDGKAVARVTSACHSPRLGQTIALGYVRREVEPPATLRLGGPEGPEARVVELPFTAG